MPFPYTLSDIRSAYAATDLTPQPGVWLGGNDCACPMGALFAERHGRAELGQLLLEDDDDEAHQSDCLEEAIADRLGLTRAQLVSFTAGYDGADDFLSDSTPLELREAFNAGTEARAEIGPERKPERVGVLAEIGLESL